MHNNFWEETNPLKNQPDSCYTGKKVNEMSDLKDEEMRDYIFLPEVLRLKFYSIPMYSCSGSSPPKKFFSEGLS